MNSDDYDFTSAGGNYFQHGRAGPKPLDLPAIDWRSRAEATEAKLREAVEVMQAVQDEDAAVWYGLVRAFLATMEKPHGN